MLSCSADTRLQSSKWGCATYFSAYQALKLKEGFQTCDNSHHIWNAVLKGKTNFCFNICCQPQALRFYSSFFCLPQRFCLVLVSFPVFLAFSLLYFVTEPLSFSFFAFSLVASFFASFSLLGSPKVQCGFTCGCEKKKFHISPPAGWWPGPAAAWLYPHSPAQPQGCIRHWFPSLGQILTLPMELPSSRAWGCPSAPGCPVPGWGSGSGSACQNLPCCSPWGPSQPLARRELLALVALWHWLRLVQMVRLTVVPYKPSHLSVHNVTVEFSLPWPANPLVIITLLVEVDTVSELHFKPLGRGYVILIVHSIK